MKLYVGITDNGWYRFLSQLPNVDEVNFWQPGGKQGFFSKHSPRKDVRRGFRNGERSLGWAFVPSGSAIPSRRRNCDVERPRRNQTTPRPRSFPNTCD